MSACTQVVPLGPGCGASCQRYARKQEVVSRGRKNVNNVQLLTVPLLRPSRCSRHDRGMGVQGTIRALAKFDIIHVQVRDSRWLVRRHDIVLLSRLAHPRGQKQLAGALGGLKGIPKHLDQLTKAVEAFRLYVQRRLR